MTTVPVVGFFADHVFHCGRHETEFYTITMTSSAILS